MPAVVTRPSPLASTPAEPAPRRDRRGDILLAAEKLFAQHGYHAVSLRQIATEAGVPLALVGYYFGAKHELFHAIFEHWAPTIDERLSRLREALLADEFTTQLAPAITNADRELFEWLARGNPGPKPPVSPPPVAPKPGTSGRASLRGRGGLSRVSDQLREFVDEHPDQNVLVEWRVE